MPPPKPLFRGQGNEPFKTADARTGAHRGQTVPYDLNGAPSGGNADTLDGHDTPYFLARANHTGTQLAATISDFSTAVGLLNSLTATTLQTGRTIGITGDLVWTSPSFNGSANVTAAGTLATVNSNVGGFGSATQVATFTVNAKGLTTAAANVSIAIPSTQVTDFTEAAQDAIGAMVDATLVYVDATPLLTRGAISGDITIAQASNVAAITAGVIVNADVNASAALAFSKMAALTVSRALVSDGSGVVTVATTTAAEIGYLNGVTSAIQTQIDGKQPLDSDLTTIAGLTATTDNFIVSVASAWASRTPAQVRTTLALVIGTNVQAWDADLDTWAGITPATGVGTFLATPSSVNLKAAVTDETGSGALVFATSPTLVTPILGTPTSGTLTNCTGLPTAGLVDDAVTYAKMQNVSATSRVMGRITAAAGDMEELTAANVKTILALAQSDISGLTTADSPQFTAVNIGHASDTTITRVSAGVIAVEGSNVLLASGLGSITQAYDADLTTIAGLTATTDNFIVSVSSAWASRTPAQVRTTLGLDTAPGVTAPTLATGWSNFGGGYRNAGYRKAYNGLVTLEGMVAGSGTATAVITTLPAGYRPASTVYFMTPSSNGTASFSHGEVRTNGDVVTYGTATTMVYLSLDSVSFYV